MTVLAAVCIPCRLAAQIDHGEITGTVEDSSNAMVQNARIALTNNASNDATNDATGNATGAQQSTQFNNSRISVTPGFL